MSKRKSGFTSAMAQQGQIGNTRFTANYSLPKGGTQAEIIAEVIISERKKTEPRPVTIRRFSWEEK